MSFHGTRPFPILLMLVYFLAVVISWVNHGVFFRPKMKMLGEELSTAHLAFCIIGTVVYISISSVAWLYAARYAKKSSQRVRLTLYGILGMFFLKDIPLFTVDFVTMMRFGWLDGYQGFCFVVQSCFFILALIATWLTFTWVVTSFFEYQWNSSDAYAHGQLEHVRVQPVPPPPPPPPVMIQEALCQRHADPSFLVQVSPSSPPSNQRDYAQRKGSLDRWGDSCGYI